MDKYKLDNFKKKAKRNWWAALPGGGLFVYPFVTDRRGKDFFKGYWPHIAYALPGLVWKAPLIGALLFGPNYCSENKSDGFVEGSKLEQVIDSTKTFSIGDSSNYYFDRNMSNYNLD